MKKLVLTLLMATFMLTACEKSETKPSSKDIERQSVVAPQSSPYIIKARGLILMQGQQADVYVGAVDAGDVILLTWHNVLAGNAGVLLVESINSGSHFTIESTTNATGWISWVIIKN